MMAEVFGLKLDPESVKIVLAYVTTQKVPLNWLIAIRDGPISIARHAVGSTVINLINICSV